MKQLAVALRQILHGTRALLDPFGVAAHLLAVMTVGYEALAARVLHRVERRHVTPVPFVVARRVPHDHVEPASADSAAARTRQVMLARPAHDRRERILHDV